MKKIDFNALRDRVYKNAVNHGFHEKKHAPYHYLMLVVSELGEAINADRKGKYAQRIMFEKNFDTPQKNPEAHWKFCFETFIKDTVEDELADAAIRILDIAGLLGLTIDDSYFTEEHMSDLSGTLKNHLFTEMLYCVVLSLNDDKVANPSCILYYLFAIANHLGFDLEWYIEQKMRYNEMRPLRHGKKY